MRTSRAAFLLGAVALAASAAVLPGTAQAAGATSQAGTSAAGITASCSGASCNGLNPAKTTCANDARTVRTGAFIDLELRYSPSCRAAWGRIGKHAPSGIKLEIRNDQGKLYRGNIASSEGGYFTVMVNDKNVKAWACGTWDGGKQTECTGGY